MSKETVFGVPVYDTDLTVSDHQQAGHMLKTYGCVVVPCLSPTELAELHHMLLRDIAEYPEYRAPDLAAEATLETNGLDYTIHVKATPAAPASAFTGRAANEKQLASLSKAIDRFAGQPIKHILGAFQAHGNAASFHCPSVRAIRAACYDKCHGLFQYIPDQGQSQSQSQDWYLQMNYDRVGYRRAGTQIEEDADKWHRDVCPLKDTVFGGWINLDLDRNQRFLCDLETDQRPEGGTGFYRDQPQGKANSVTIPPGHCIIFYQYILHAIAPTKFPHDSLRLFISFMLTTQGPQRPAQQDIWTRQLVPNTPSGQPIKVWMSNHHISALLWSHTIVWALVTFKEEYIVRKSGRNGTVYYVPLSPMSLPVLHYPPYTEQETAILKPQPLEKLIS